MASNKTLLERCLPLLFALVVLISSLPALPAAAAEDPVDPNAIYTVSGTWIFNQYVTVPDSSIVQSVSFSSDGFNYSYMRFLPTGIRYAADSDESGVIVTEDQLYDGKFTFLNPEDRTVSFDSTQVVSQSFYQYLISNAVKSEDYQDPEPDVMTATFIIDSEIYVFAGTESSLPEITVDVTSGAFVLRSGSTSYFFEFSPGSIIGFKLSSIADSYVGVGEALVFYSDYSSDSYTIELYPVYSSSVTYTSTINLYLDDGTFWDRFVFQSIGKSPNVVLSLTDEFIIISSGDQSYTRGIHAETLIGLSKVPGSSVISYIAGYDYTLSGAYGENVAHDLSVVLSTSDNPSYDGVVGGGISEVFEEFTDFLIRPVSAFFAVEFIPGFSFGKLGLVAFLLGLLFWILKVSK